MVLSVLGAGMFVDMLLREWLKRGIKVFGSYVCDELKDSVSSGSKLSVCVDPVG